MIAANVSIEEKSGQSHNTRGKIEGRRKEIYEGMQYRRSAVGVSLLDQNESSSEGG